MRMSLPSPAKNVDSAQADVVKFPINIEKIHHRTSDSMLDMARRVAGVFLGLGPRGLTLCCETFFVVSLHDVQNILQRILLELFQAQHFGDFYAAVRIHLNACFICSMSEKPTHTLAEIHQPWLHDSRAEML
jgi:hypothetical protein